MAYQKKTWTNDVSELSAENFNPMEEGIFGAYPVQLIAIDSTAPSTCSTGDKYYNTTSKKIYTATGTNTWGTNGETPLEDTVYYLINAKQTYIWDSANEVLALIGDGSTGISTDHLVNVSNEVDEDYRVNVIHSKNILNNTLSTQTKNNITFTKNSDGSITLNGTASASTTLTLGIVSLKSGKTYTLSGGADLSTNTARLDMRLSDNGTIYDNWYIPEYTTKTMVNDITLYASIRVQSGASFTNKVIYPMLEEGSTATTYEAFIQNQIVVDNEKYTDTLNVGASLDSRSRVNVLYSKNLFDASIQAGTYSNATYSVASDGKITQSASDSSQFVLGDKRNFKLKKGTYTASIIGKPNNVNFQMRNITASSNVFEGTNNSYTFTLTDDSYVALKCWSGSATYPIDYYIMLVEGSSALDYEPYITPSIYLDNEMLVSKNVYSTGEVVIGEWLGKPLYRKVINIGALTNASLKTTAHGISNVDIVYKVSGITYDSGYNFFPLPFSSKVSNESISLFANRTNIYTNCGTDRTSFTTTYITLEYTKTTD